MRPAGAPLDAATFLRWTVCQALWYDLQSKEGRERLKTRVNARLAEEQDAALAAALDNDEDGDGDGDEAWAPPHLGVDADADDPMGRTVAIRGQLGAADRAALDGARVGDAVFTTPDLLLRLLPPDDPRAVFVRAGGRLDAWGDPVVKGGTRHRTRADAPTPASGTPAPPAPPSWQAQTVAGPDASPSPSPVAVEPTQEPPDTANGAERAFGRAVAERQGRGFAASSPDDLADFLR